MKTICAWCGSTITVACDHCGAPLVPTTTLGASLPFAERDALVCTNGLTPVLYYVTAIYRMKTTHGICKNCAALPQTERDARLTQRRLRDPRLPSAADLDAICAERELADKHEAETRSINRQDANPKKRGPTGVPEAPTSTRRDDTRKRGKP